MSAAASFVKSWLQVASELALACSGYGYSGAVIQSDDLGVIRRDGIETRNLTSPIVLMKKLPKPEIQKFRHDFRVHAVALLLCRV